MFYEKGVVMRIFFILTVLVSATVNSEVRLKVPRMPPPLFPAPDSLVECSEETKAYLASLSTKLGDEFKPESKDINNAFGCVRTISSYLELANKIIKDENNLYNQLSERIAIHRLNFVLDLIEIRQISFKKNDLTTLKVIDEKLYSIFENTYIDSSYPLTTDRNILAIKTIKEYFDDNSSISNELQESTKSFFMKLEELDKERDDIE